MKKKIPLTEERITWDESYMEMVNLIARRGTCPRKKVGAIIVDKQKRIISSGYNGAPRGMPHCTEVGCMIVKENDIEHCIRAIHAELNALLQAGRKAEGCTLYCTTLPCPKCYKPCIQAGIERIVYQEDYNRQDLDYWIENAKIKLVQWQG
jgi:dCMP deaminase